MTFPVDHLDRLCVDIVDDNPEGQAVGQAEDMEGQMQTRQMKIGEQVVTGMSGGDGGIMRGEKQLATLREALKKNKSQIMEKVHNFLDPPPPLG